MATARPYQLPAGFHRRAPALPDMHPAVTPCRDAHYPLGWQDGGDCWCPLCCADRRDSTAPRYLWLVGCRLASINNVWAYAHAGD